MIPVGAPSSGGGSKPSPVGGPTFLAQKRTDDTLRAMLRRTLFHATGQPPSAAELDIAVRREFAELSAQLRRGAAPVELKRTVEADPPKSASPSDTWLNAAELRDAESAHVYARTHGVKSLLEAVRWFHVNRGSTESAPLLEQCVDEFLCVKRAERRAEITIAGYRSKLVR